MSLKVEPGIYWLGDPCYVLNDERYQKLTDEIKDDGAYTYDERLLDKELISIALPTHSGDGEYPVLKSLYTSKISFLSDSIALTVDSGLVAITSFELVENLDKYDEPLGIKIEVLEPIHVYSDSGILSFGSVTVDTVCENEDEDDHYDDIDEDEDDEWSED